ncbi:MAG: hypothetical protein DCC49_13910, partial [Acidobacteria bacterium]
GKSFSWKNVGIEAAIGAVTGGAGKAFKAVRAGAKAATATTRAGRLARLGTSLSSGMRAGLSKVASGIEKFVAPMAKLLKPLGALASRFREDVVRMAGRARAVIPGLAKRGSGDVLPRPHVTSAKLQNIVDDLYKGTTNPKRVGSGTTADAVRYERQFGKPVHGRYHGQKAEDSLRGLENWLKANPAAPHHDRLVARSLADELLDALGRAP